MTRLPSMLAAALSGTLLLAACGGSTSSSSSLASTTPSASASSSAPAKSVAVGDTVPIGDLVKSTEAAMKAAGSAHVMVTVEGQPAQIVGDASYKGATPSTHFVMSSGDDGFTVITVDGATYVNVTGSTSQSGKPWTKLDSTTQNPALGFMAALFQIMAQQIGQPMKTYASIPSGSATVTAVEGSLVTYSIEVTQAQVDATPVPTPEVLKTLITVDAHGRPLTIHAVLGQRGITAEYSAWGEPLSIVAPDPADVQTETPSASPS